LNRQSTRGSAACHLSVDDTGGTVAVANYETGSVACIPVCADGTLAPVSTFAQHEGSSVNPARQESPHAHCVRFSPDNRFVCAADLGLDRVVVYEHQFAESRPTLKPASYAIVPVGAGPRHLHFHPNARFLYVLNELGNSVTVFAWDDSHGRLTQLQTISMLPDDWTGESYCADLAITPNARWLYATNRGHDSITAYSIADDGRLTLIGTRPSGGKEPQNLAIAPGGEVLLCANMKSDTVAIFLIDAKSGRLVLAGEPQRVPSPSCIQFL
jgi:6-phosphogluconolactonase